MKRAFGTLFIAFLSFMPAMAIDFHNFSISVDVDQDDHEDIVAVKYIEKEFSNYLQFIKKGRVIWQRKGLGYVTLLVRDVTGDRRPELLYHELYDGSAAAGFMMIFGLGKVPPRILLHEKTFFDELPLWDIHTKKIGPNPHIFRDYDRDGRPEIVFCREDRGCDIHGNGEEPRWLDLYKWNGSHFVRATAKIPSFVAEQRKYYSQFAREKGLCPPVREYLRRLGSGITLRGRGKIAVLK